MKPKLFAVNHQVRLYLDDEELLQAMQGDKAATKIRELVHKALQAK